MGGVLAASSCVPYSSGGHFELTRCVKVQIPLFDKTLFMSHGGKGDYFSGGTKFYSGGVKLPTGVPLEGAVIK